MEKKITKKMREQLREEWLLALEGKLLGADGKPLKQGRSSLRLDGARGPQYCCLGVVCEIARRHGFISEEEVSYDPYNSQSFVVGYSGATRYMPSKIARLFGFLDEYGSIGQWAGYEDALAYENDQGTSFKAIAMKIRSGEWNVWTR